MNKYSIMVCNAYFLKDKIHVNDFSNKKKEKKSDLLTYKYEFIVVVCSFWTCVQFEYIFEIYIYIYIIIQ